MSTSFDGLVFSFTLEDGLEHWQLQHLHGTATHPTLGEVATLSGYLIYRRMLDGNFLVMMDMESDEIHEFGITLFDRNGILKPRHKTGYRSGTGCWGDELNDDALAYIVDITVKDEYRHQGIGSQLLKGLRDSEHKSQISSIVSWPFSRDDPGVNGFFVKNGFRRIGRTQFLGYSMDPKHPSHQILASDDVQKSVKEEFPPRSEDEMPASTPSIHGAIRSDMSSFIAQVIRRAHEADPESLYAPNGIGFLPMHVAVHSKNTVAFKTLLELGRVEDLHNHHNANGATPVELLRDSMVNDREFTETLLSAKWSGFSDAELSMEYAAKTAMGMDTGCATVQSYIDQNKHGCTCGRCLGGWLSPRMFFQLEVQAALSMDTMPLIGELAFNKRQSIDASRVHRLHHGDCIPPSQYHNLSPAFYKGFIAVFRAAYDLLERSSLFTAETVCSHARSAYSSETTTFFEKGGKVEYALDAITAGAMDQSMTGDREFYAIFGDDEEFVALPTCGNDNEFGLVRRMVGLDPKKQWAPYGRPREDDESDEEDFGGVALGGMPDAAAMMAFMQRLMEAKQG